MARAALMVGAGAPSLALENAGFGAAATVGLFAAGASLVAFSEHAAKAVASPTTPINHQGHERTRRNSHFFARLALR